MRRIYCNLDADYRGNVGVILFNHADEEFIVKRGDRVAQLILERISYADIEIVEEMDATERGAGGFGSTGVDASLKRPRQPGMSLYLFRMKYHIYLLFL
jgi:hypothetical protein